MHYDKINVTKPQEEKKEPEVIGGGTLKKKTLKDKVVELILPVGKEDIKSYVLKDLIIPKVKDTVFEFIKYSLYGPNGKGFTTPTSSLQNPNSFNYNKESMKGSRMSSVYTTGNIEFSSEEKAYDVLRQLKTIVHTESQVSVATAYVIAGITPEYTDNNWGWFSLENAYVDKSARHTQNGIVYSYELVLPRAKPLNR